MSTFLVHYGILALLLLSLVKGIGVPVPIPADLVVLAAATGSASGKLVVWEAFGAVLVGMVGGGLVQFALVRGPGRNVLYRFGPRVGLTASRLDLGFQRVEGVGILGIAIAVVTPGIRTASIPACGLTRLPVRTFAAGLTLGTTAYIALQFFVAYGIARFALKFWDAEDKAWLWFLLVPLAVLISAVIVRHQTRHLGELKGSLAEEARSLRSHRCPLCWLTAFADHVAHRNEIFPPDDDGAASHPRPAAPARTEPIR